MSRFALFAVIVAGATAILLQQLLMTDRGDTPQLHSATVLSQPRALNDFKLVDHNGDDFTRSALEGQWSLLFAGFTHCPDICPATLALLRQLEQHLASNPQFVFLSLDPERDTPQVLSDYLGYFSRDFVGVTGDKAQLDVLCDGLGLAYVHIPESEGRYTVDHSSALVLIDPNARVVAYFTLPLSIDSLQQDLTALLGKPR